MFATTTDATHLTSAKVCVIKVTALVTAVTSPVPRASIVSIVLSSKGLIFTTHIVHHREWASTSACAAHFISFEVYSIKGSARESIGTLFVPIARVITCVCVDRVRIVALWLWVEGRAIFRWAIKEIDMVVMAMMIMIIIVP